MTSRKALLSSLLLTLVQEWGQKEVEAMLASLPESRISTRWPANGETPGSQRNRSNRKLLASEQVMRAQLPESQKIVLREIAMLFDRKQFLPSIPDVREFLIMIDEMPGTMKDRSEAFRRLLEGLTKLPPKQLERLANSALHAGPSQLGSFSDAISTAAKTTPRRSGPSVS